jgi:hypothetical protein
MTKTPTPTASTTTRSALVTHIQSAITVDKGELLIGVDTYHNSLTLSELSVETAKAVHAHDALYAGASVEALGLHALNMFRVDNELSVISGTAHIGDSTTVNTKVYQEREVRNPGTGATSIIHGSTVVSCSISAHEIKDARSSVRTAAEALFAAKG